MTPDFSIITPSFNYARYIRDCIDSVQAQHGATWEHIVVDGGSKDETPQILRTYPHLRVLSEPDEGMSDAINKGFNLARGTWAMWLNADDRLRPGALAEVLAFIQQHPEADVVYGSFNFVDEEGRVLRRMSLLPFCWLVCAHHGVYIPSTATFYRRATVLDEGFRLEKRLRIIMDAEFYARLHRSGKRFRYFPCILADFRLHSRNQSTVTLCGRGDFDSEYKAAIHAAEGEAVVRTYGFSPFRNRVFNHVSDCVLYLVAWGLKGMLKLPYFHRLREPRPPAKGSEVI